MDLNSLDPVQRLAWDSEGFTCAVLGSPNTHEFFLVDLDESGTPQSPLSEGELLIVRLKNYEFCGVLGVVRGQCGAKSERPEVLGVMLLAALEFANRVAARMKTQHQADDWADSMRRLYELPDNRS